MIANVAQYTLATLNVYSPIVNDGAVAAADGWAGFVQDCMLRDLDYGETSLLV